MVLHPSSRVRGAHCWAGRSSNRSAWLNAQTKVRGEEHMDDDLRGVLKNKVESAISPSGSVKSPMRNSFGFLCCGSVILNRDAVGRRRLYLDKVVYPLKGTVELHSHCTPLPPVMEAIVRGYLRMSEDMGCSWARYWTVLHHGMVRFWNCPTDEASEKRPVGCIDLTNCILNKLMPLGRGIHSCPPNTFSVEVLIGSAPKVLTKR
ncbi:unnamed protein product [Toxocara canis]|uniref:Cytochrome P450 n=1 Tax=Toxocara canis TaxID=6265 RepID=A0A183V8S6_TOXCA|nr:unnamed protein product [Toxocara canis]